MARKATSNRTSMTARPITDSLRRQVREELPEVAKISDLALQEKTVEAWAFALAQSTFKSIRDIPPAGNPDTNEAKRGDQTDHLRGVTRLAIGIAEEMGAAYPELAIDMDVIIAGGLVHDVGKAWEFDPANRKRWKGRLARVPFVFTRHHSDHNIRLGKKWHTRIDGWCAKRADHVIAVSEVTRRIMIEIEGVPEQKITVVYNGMEPLDEPSPERIERTRQELEIGNEPVLLMIGRLHEEKGHRYLFDALPSVISRVGHVKVLLAGDGPERTRIEGEAERAGVRDYVRFLGRRDDVPELISLSSVVVLPSLAESFGFAALEAMSLGKPVVAAATGGIPEIVTDGETGLLVPPADSQSLSQALISILSDTDLASRIGEAGRRRASFFSFEKMIAGYQKVYDNTLGAAWERWSLTGALAGG